MDGKEVEVEERDMMDISGGKVDASEKDISGSVLDTAQTHTEIIGVAPGSPGARQDLRVKFQGVSEEIEEEKMSTRPETLEIDRSHGISGQGRGAGRGGGIDSSIDDRLGKVSKNSTDGMEEEYSNVEWEKEKSTNNSSGNLCVDGGQYKGRGEDGTHCTVEDGLKIDEDGEFIPVGKRSKDDFQIGSNTFVGVNLRRSGEDPRFNKDDLEVLFQIVQSVDPNAMILNAKGDCGKAKKLRTMIKMSGIDMTTFLDLKTIPWGAKQDNKKQTTLQFWLSSSVIGEGLQELRQSPAFRQYLQAAGNCSMGSTMLCESRHRLIGYFEGKNPRHTYRKELALRVSNHLSLNSSNPEKKWPVQVVATRVSNVSVLAMLVGEKDSKMAASILEKHPFPDVEIILNSWKKRDNDGFMSRVRQHKWIMEMSKAFKLMDVDQQLSLPRLKQILRESEAGEYIVDICTARSSNENGTVCVQYVQSQRDLVLQHLQSILDKPLNPSGSVFPAQAKLMNPDASVTQTVATSETVVPMSRFAKQFDATDVDIVDAPKIPKAISTKPREKPKSFSEAVRKSLEGCDSSSVSSNSDGNESEHSNASTLTRKTRGSKSSRKTARECTT